MNGQLSALRATSTGPQVAAATTPWVCIAGAKGGVGKTTIAVNLALLLARAGYRTLLADLDPGCGDVGVHLRLAGADPTGDGDGGTFVPGPNGLTVMLGASGSTRLFERDSMQRQLDRLSVAARDFDVVVTDTGAGIGVTTMAVAERADLVLAVTTPDAPAVTDTYAFMKVLHQRGGNPARLVVNRARSYDQAVRTAHKLSTVTERFLGNATTLGATVTRAEELELSVAEQRPLTLDPDRASTGKAIADLHSLCADVLAEIPDVRAHRRAVSDSHRLRPTATVSRSSAV